MKESTSGSVADAADSDGESGLDRRRFIGRVGAGTAIVGGAWVAPSIIGTSVAFAEGSAGGGDDGLLPPDGEPDVIYCGTMTWPKATDNNPSKPAAWLNYPLASDDPNVSLVSVTNALVGPNPPITVNPQVAAGAGANFGYRHLMANARPWQGQGLISGVPDVAGNIGLVIVQNNVGGGNTSFGSIANYQEVTFTFSTVIKNLRFTIRDLSANTIDGNNTSAPVVDIENLGPPTGGWVSNGAHRDAVSFNRPISVTGGNTTNLTGTGTHSNPLRRTTKDDWFSGISSVYAPFNVPMDVEILMPGPLMTFTLRYATVGGQGNQYIQLSNFEFGENC